jgi:hypothetical protein
MGKIKWGGIKRNWSDTGCMGNVELCADYDSLNERRDANEVISWRMQRRCRGIHNLLKNVLECY